MFLLADINVDIVLEMPFFILSNIEIDFINCHIYWRTYIIAVLFQTTRQVELIEGIKFVAATLNLNNEAFVVYVTSISFTDLNVYLFQRAQIASLKVDEIPTFVESKYANFVNIFCKNLVTKLSEHIDINDYAIHLIKGYQPSYKPIYSL